MIWLNVRTKDYAIDPRAFVSALLPLVDQRVSDVSLVHFLGSSINALYLRLL